LGIEAERKSPEVFDEPMIQHLHSGCALLIGTVDETGLPHAGRGHGLTVVDPAGGVVRLLVDAEDATTLANLRRPGAAVAVTTAAVPTLHSFQIKGRVGGVEDANDADNAKHLQYATDFMNDIHNTDGDAIELLERWVLRPIVACVVHVDACFDQTPGPSAGTLLTAAAS
jgi:hypothetical protein